MDNLHHEILMDIKMFEKDEYISLKEVAELLMVSTLTLRNWDKNGTLVAYRNPVNNYRVYKLSQIQNFLDEMEGSRKGKRFRLRVVSVDD